MLYQGFPGWHLLNCRLSALFKAIWLEKMLFGMFFFLVVLAEKRFLVFFKNLSTLSLNF